IMFTKRSFLVFALMDQLFLVLADQPLQHTQDNVSGKAVAVAGSAGIWLYTDTFQNTAYLDGYLVGQYSGFLVRVLSRQSRKAKRLNFTMGDRLTNTPQQ